MKILFVSDMNIEFVCGSTYFCKRLATLLQKRGHEVAFMCPSGKSQYKSCARYTFDGFTVFGVRSIPSLDRKSTRLNSSHSSISYAVFCLKKKTEQP